MSNEATAAAAAQGDTKTFFYEEDGLSYMVTVYEQDGEIFADINVVSGFMDVNAVYYGDDDFSGDSAGLGGPLNMNGAGSVFEGEQVQWDDAIELSRPGLGREGSDKPTFLSEGDTLTVQLNVSSIDDVDFFGIRATSTSTPEGSIKGVSGDPETNDHDDNGGDDNGDDSFKLKFFYSTVNEDGSTSQLTDEGWFQFVEITVDDGTAFEDIDLEDLLCSVLEGLDAKDIEVGGIWQVTLVIPGEDGTDSFHDFTLGFDDEGAPFLIPGSATRTDDETDALLDALCTCVASDELPTDEELDEDHDMAA